MKFPLTVAMGLFVTSTLLGQQPGSTPAPSPAPPSAGTTAAETPPTPTPTPTLVDNLIKLWKANLSEDFLRKYISGADIAKDLSAEDIVKLRNAGLPESLISAVSERKVAVMPPPVPATSPVTVLAPTPTPATSMKWEGLARRNSGVVLLKSRWDPGVLEFKDETLRWTDARDAAKNVLLTAKQMTEQQLTCLKKSGGNECFEWVVKSKGQEYRFRDVAWEQGENAKVTELFSYFRSRYPNLVSSQVPVDEK
ncbi:MAG: hypothetical protein ACHQM4_00565 [Thermoanaerobaculia bacterium]